MTLGDGILSVSFLVVAFSAKHLAIAGFRFAAFTPRDDMVSFHLVNSKVLSANGADTFLLFVGGAFV